MTDAKATICYLNGLSLRTINEVEKILRELPRKGDRCELQMTKPSKGDISRSTGDVLVAKSLQIRDEPKPLVLSPPKISEVSMKDKKYSKSGGRKNSEYSCMSSIKEEIEQLEIRTTTTNNTAPPKSRGKLHCKVLTDQVRVSPIVSCNGVILELDVEVTIPDREEKKKLKLEIECPDFVPSRIKIGNKWKNII